MLQLNKKLDFNCLGIRLHLPSMTLIERLQKINEQRHNSKNQTDLHKHKVEAKKSYGFHWNYNASTLFLIGT